MIMQTTLTKEKDPVTLKNTPPYIKSIGCIVCNMIVSLYMNIGSVTKLLIVWLSIHEERALTITYPIA